MKALLCLLFAFQTYKVQTPAGIVALSPEDYVAGVVSGESSEFRSEEALKAMAVAARTYAMRMQGRHSKEGYDFCATTHCQRYLKPGAREIRAAHDTQAQVLWFNGQPAFAAYSRSCGGHTEDVSAVWPDIVAPYLHLHSDPYCSSNWNWSDSLSRIREALLQAGLKAPEKLKQVAVVRRSRSGRAQVLSLSGDLISASAFRFAIGRTIGWNTIRSEQYTVETTGDQVDFRGSGEGHGVGLCQRGADQMGVIGRSYREILAFYYPGTHLGVNAVDFRWKILSGEGVVLYTMRREFDKDVIAIAERAVQKWRAKLPWPAPARIDIYTYPDLNAFRDATGEPGWVAARTSVTKIELQPVSVLRSHDALKQTLEHEIIHCFVESAARPGLPVWFREGLVEQLAGNVSKASGFVPGNAEIRQRQNYQAAEAGYQAAERRVKALVDQYGQAAVLTWVTRGLPAEAKNSKASNPPVNNK